MDYRRYYKEYYNIDFNESYEIHHIDEDRTNNDIDNLILLPKDLHKELHLLKVKGWILGLDKGKFKLELNLIIPMILVEQIGELKNIIDVYSKISEYVEYKYFNYKNGRGEKIKWQL